MDAPFEPTPAPSLVDRLMAKRPRPVSPITAPHPAATSTDWAKAALLFALLVAGPGLSIAINAVAIDRAQSELAALQARTTPAEVAAASARMGRDVLAAATERPAPVATVTRLAQALPADSRIARLAQSQGRLEIDIATSDPDQLRERLRRDPALARLRETGQRQGDGVLVVALEELQ